MEVAREDTIAELRRAAPGWESERAEEAMNPVEVEAGFVTTRTDPSELLATPLAEILSKAEELSSREERFLVECDPYRGLAVAWPVRALSALVVAGKRGEFPGVGVEHVLDSRGAEGGPGAADGRYRASRSWLSTFSAGGFLSWGDDVGCGTWVECSLGGTLGRFGR